MRFCSVHMPGGKVTLCSIGEDGGLVPVGVGKHRLADIAALISATNGQAPNSLEDAVEIVGTASKPIISWDVVERAQPSANKPHLVAPVMPFEIWAAGVTYERSLTARMEESHEPDIYERVYSAPRPELFLKATGPRVVGPNGAVGLRADSHWQVPEPECAVVLGKGGAILGYTLGNDMSSRDIEGENPLYLPQAKIYAGSCAIGPVVVSASEIENPYDLEITIQVLRNEHTVFEGSTSTQRLHTRLETLTEYLLRDNWIGLGTVLLTGTGIVPPEGFTLEVGDLVEISSPQIGTLRNHCWLASTLTSPVS